MLALLASADQVKNECLGFDLPIVGMACVLSLMACNIKEVSHALLIMDALIFNVNFVVDRIDLTYLPSRLSVPSCGNKGRYCM